MKKVRLTFVTSVGILVILGAIIIGLVLGYMPRDKTSGSLPFKFPQTVFAAVTIATEEASLLKLHEMLGMAIEMVVNDSPVDTLDEVGFKQVEINFV